LKKINATKIIFINSFTKIGSLKHHLQLPFPPICPFDPGTSEPDNLQTIISYTIYKIRYAIKHVHEEKKFGITIYNVFLLDTFFIHRASPQCLGHPGCWAALFWRMAYCYSIKICLILKVRIMTLGSYAPLYSVCGWYCLDLILYRLKVYR
jgi:hypothetical protein